MFSFGRPDVAKMQSKSDIQGLIKALQHKKDVQVRTSAATALGILKDPAAVEHLIATLKDQSDEVRCASARALGHIGDVRAFAPLVQSLKDSSYKVWGAASEALKSLIGSTVVDSAPLIDALHDEQYYIRRIATELLGRMGSPQSVDVLITISLRDQSDVVRAAAINALGLL